MRRDYIKWIAIAAITAFVSLVAIGCQGGTKKEARPIKIGVIDAFTGPAATYTRDGLDGLQLAVKEANEKGVLGTKIEILQRDDQWKPDISLSWAKELVMRENVDVIVGFVNSAAALSVSDYLKGAKVPMMTWGAQTSKLTQEKGHRYVFSIVPNTSISGRAAAVRLSKLPYTKYWLTGSDHEYGHSLVDAVWNNLKQMKPDVVKVGESWWRVGEADYTPYLNTIMAAKPEVVIAGMVSNDQLPFLKAVNATGLNKRAKVWMHTMTDVSTLKPLGAEAPEGALGTNFYHYYYPDTPENKAFVEKFRSQYNREPGFVAVYGYLAGKFIATAFEKAGSLDREKFVDALEQVEIDSPLGKVKFRQYDHQAELPIFFGVTAKDPNLPYLTATDIVTIPASEVMPPIEEIKKKREGK